MSYRCLYLSPALTHGVVIDEPRLAGTSERHKLQLDAPPGGPTADPLHDLDHDPQLAGVILEMRAGWPGLRQMRLATAVLRRGRRAWLYWPNEHAVECLDRDRLKHAYRLWLVATAYLAVSGQTSRLAAAVRAPNSIVRRLLWGKSPGEWRITMRGRSILAALRDRAVPVGFTQPLPPSPASKLAGTGIYLRLDFWAPIESGGSYGHTCYVAKELAAVTEQFHCFMANRFSLLDEFGIPQHVLPPPAATAGENVIMEASYAYYPLLRRELAALQPAYIYERLVIGNYAGAMLSQELGVPYIVEYNGSELSMRRSFDNSRYVHEDIYLRAEALAFEQATLVSVVSSEIKASLVARGVPDAKILVNPNGADLVSYAPAPPDEKRRLREELGFTDTDRVIGFSGTFGGWHGVDVLAEAMPRICAEAPDAKFLLIGDGTYKALVDTAIRVHHLEARVVAAGRVPQTEGARLLKACDVFVSPHSSHMVDSRFFGSPTKLFEYMAMRGGVVASDLEQIGEVLSPAFRPRDLGNPDLTVSSQRAVLCTPGSVDEFVTAVLALVRRPDICEALGRNARQAVADEFSWTRHVERLWKFAAPRRGMAPARPRRRATAIGRRRLETILRVEAPAAPPPVARPLPVPAAGVVSTGDAYKDEVQRQWNNDPAGSHYVKDAELHTLEWFLEAERYRYRDYAPWMHDVMEFARHAGERVLEIGGGMGTDLAQFARHGAIVTDLDLASGHLDLAKENFRLRGLSGAFVLHDAETLPFEDETFDVVYSNGVLHHTPNTTDVVREIHRVLKPGGRAIIMMYAEESIHYWRNLVWSIGLKDRELLERSMGEILSHAVERSDSASARPLVKVYSRKGLTRMFGQFEDVSIVQRQMVSDEVPRLLARVPVAMLGKIMGWNLIVKATKGREASTGARAGGPAETARASDRP